MENFLQNLFIGKETGNNEEYEGSARKKASLGFFFLFGVKRRVELQEGIIRIPD